MSEKKRTTVSLHTGIIAQAQEIMAHEHYSDFSGFIEQLIRERYEQRRGSGAAPIHETPPPYQVTNPLPRHSAPSGGPGAANSPSGKTYSSRKKRISKQFPTG